MDANREIRAAFEDGIVRDEWGYFVDGRERPAAAGGLFSGCDPRTGAPGFAIARCNPDDVSRAVASARSAYRGWRGEKPAVRAQILHRVGQALRVHADTFVRLEQKETGKPHRVARSDVDTAARYFEYYAGLAEVPLGNVIDLGNRYHAYTMHEPYGVVGVILPWNAPINQAARAIAPALAAGNTVVAKPSEFTSVSLLSLARVAFEHAGLPSGALNVVTGTGDEAGAALVSHRDIRKIAFTGSVRAGQAIAHIAADRVLPLSLELGGKSANIVFADADRDRAIAGVIEGFTNNSGQLCSAGTRCFVERSIAHKFVEGLKIALEAIAVGGDDPSALGPLITESQFARVQDVYERARSDPDGEFVCGAAPATKQGFFVSPAIFITERVDHPLMTEEVFGPLLTITTFSDEDEVVQFANAGEYGLAAGLWTRDLARAHRVASALEAGQVYVNEYFAGGVETPFGGFKMSGYGREKGLEALRHYTHVKSVAVRL